MADSGEGAAPDATRRPLRSDAARNQTVILAAARTLHAESGLGVSFDDIARRAGVGVGTVYRRFPDRNALLAALFEDRFAAVDALAQQALESADAWRGLETFVLESVRMFSEDRGLRESAFDPDNQFPGIADQRARLALLLSRVTDRAHEAGVLRVDCEARDLASIIAMLSSLTTPPVGEPAWGRGAVGRCAGFVLAGVRSGPGRGTPA